MRRRRFYILSLDRLIEHPEHAAGPAGNSFATLGNALKSVATLPPGEYAVCTSMAYPILRALIINGASPEFLKRKLGTLTPVTLTVYPASTWPGLETLPAPAKKSKDWWNSAAAATNMRNAELMGTYWHCSCGHSWFVQKKDPPKRCPKCGIGQLGRRKKRQRL